MKAHPIGTTQQFRRLRTRALWFSLLVVPFAIALAARPKLQEGRAQSPPPAAVLQNTANSMQGASAQELAPESRTKQAAQTSTIDPRKELIAEESTSLLSLARSLKTEVDKTTKDTLSVTVIRKAGEIEQLAHNMRTK